MLKNVAILVSGGGTNLQAIIDAKGNGLLPHANLALVLSSKPDVYALTRSENANIPHCVIGRKDYPDTTTFNTALLETLVSHHIDVVVLAGFLSILDTQVISAYEDRIINVHPSLIPSFCGKGFYGIKVHECVLAKGVKVTGATVHLVNEIPDGGRILLQKAVSVAPNDTPQTLQKRVMEQAEWELLPMALDLLTKPQ